MRRVPLLLIIVAILGGCATTKPGPASEPDVAGPVSYAMCDERAAFFGLDPAVVQPHLPKGFTPAPLDPAGLTAVAFVLAINCESARVASGEAVAGVSLAVAAYGIIPPAEYARTNASGHALLLGLVTDAPAIERAFAAWNFTAALGEVMLGPSAGGMTRVRSGGEFTFDVTTRAPSATSESAGAERFFSARDGVVVAAFDWEWSAGAGMEGAATLDGHAGFDMGPGPQPTGFGYHYMGEGDRYVHRPVDVPTS